MSALSTYHSILRLTCTFLFLASHFPHLSAQVDYSVDSLRVVEAEWRVDSMDGFVYKSYHFGEGELFCSAQHLFVIEIPADSPRRLAFVHDTMLTEVSTLAERRKAFAAINGSYFDMLLGNPVCYLRIDGKTVGENTPAKDDSVNRKYYQYATLALRRGRPQLTVPDSNRLSEEQMKEKNIMTAGPMLLREGAMVPQRDDRTFVTHRHNRTALGVRPDGTTLLVVADGRFKHKAEGFSLPELERVMLWLGCTEAINLDGGGSTTMYIKNNGVVNYPSDNNRHDHEGQRPVSNAILLL
ncbi:MAG: phosphodiester glycosidase family protein [bacterium]